MTDGSRQLPGPIAALAQKFSIDQKRVRLLHRFWDHYDSLGLIRNGLPVCLHTNPAHQKCWEGREPPEENMHHYGIHLPWIGERFAESRILAIGINPRGADAFGTSMQWGVHRHVSEYFNGSTPAFPMGFHVAMATYAAAIAASLNGQAPTKEPVSRGVLGEAHQHVALLEAVKCPTPHHGPTSQMWANCPAAVDLVREVEILEPRVLLIIGQPQRDYFKGELSGDWEHGPYRRFDTEIRSKRIDVVTVCHPQQHIRGGWRGTSLLSLVEDLRARPVVI